MPISKGSRLATYARRHDGSIQALPIQRWLDPADAVDEHILRRVRGPVLDVGCGPGRHLHALARRGVFALGVDISSAAVARARSGGATAIVASIFDELPGDGRWGSALLLDGNVGIGGRPARLLRRVAGLLRPGGQILVELSGPGSPVVCARIRLQTPRHASAWFPWADLGIGQIDAVAQRAGLTTAAGWCDEGRWFALLARRGGG